MTGSSGRRPFAPGSVSVGLHSGVGLTAHEQVEQLLREARGAEDSGFDGVTISEHHAGFPGYVPQPLTFVSWILTACERVWSAPAPTLLGLRSPRLLAEELAWVAARFPGRLGVAVAPGYAQSDFDAVRVPFEDRLSRFASHLDDLVSALAPDGPLAADAAIASGALASDGVLVAANSTAAVRRAVRHGVGMLFPGGESAERLRALVDDYRSLGGGGPAVAIAVVWLGEGAADNMAEAAYRAAAAPGMRQRSGFAQGPFVGSSERVAEQLHDFVVASRISAVNLRFRDDSAAGEMVLEQMRSFTADVLPHLRAAFATTPLTGNPQDV